MAYEMRNSLIVFALIAVIETVTACSNHGGSAASSDGATSVPATFGSAATVSAVGNRTRGRTIFRENCAVCHGANGTEGGGVGPSLKNERLAKNTDETIAWIKNPAPPMPKLFPKPLNSQDVEDVAAYVQSL